MTVIVTDGTAKEYIEYEPGCDLKNVFRDCLDMIL